MSHSSRLIADILKFSPTLTSHASMDSCFVIKCILLALVLILLKKGLSLLRKLLVQLREHYVMWNVAFGARADRRNVPERLRLHPYVCQTVLLDNLSIKELYTFGKEMFDTEVTVEQFHQVVLRYKYVLLCREKIDGSMRGMAFFGKSRSQEVNGSKCTLIKVGLTFFNVKYQGGPIFYYVILYHIFKEMIKHPTVPVFVMGKAFSYKSYLMLVNSVTSTYPRYDAPTPDYIKAILHHFANTERLPGEEYDPASFVLKREKSHIKRFVAPITEKDLKNPHIKFFVENNPGWSKGHVMLCAAQFTKLDLLKVLLKGLKRSLGINRSSSKQKKLRQSFNRSVSYQTRDAVNEVLEFYDLDSEGHPVPLFEPSNSTYIPPPTDDPTDNSLLNDCST